VTTETGQTPVSQHNEPARTRATALDRVLATGIATGPRGWSGSVPPEGLYKSRGEGNVEANVESLH
jgi:hypothetical protein